MLQVSEIERENTTNIQVTLVICSNNVLRDHHNEFLARPSQCSFILVKQHSQQVLQSVYKSSKFPFLVSDRLEPG